MKKHIKNLSLAFLTISLLSGCVMGRRTVDLEIPILTPKASNQLSVSVANVEDARLFQNRPPNPSTPSIDGDVDRISQMERSRMIGRQRNTYGKAMGDVALPENATVGQKVQLLLEEGLKARGYTIGSGDTDYVVDIRVDEFWGWFTPGMFSVTFNARINCAVIIRGESKSESLNVAGQGENKAQIASDANWQLTYKRAFEDFLENFIMELERKGL